MTGVVAEQRFRAAVAGKHAAGAVEHQDAVGRGVEDGFKLVIFRFDPPQRLLGRLALSVVGHRLRIDHQHQRVLFIPGDAEQAAFDRPLIAVDGGDGQRLGAVAVFRHLALGFDEQAVEAAGFRQRVERAVAGPVEEGAVGIDQVVEPVDQDADRQPVEDRPAFAGVAGGVAIARGARRLGRRRVRGEGAAGIVGTKGSAPKSSEVGPALAPLAGRFLQPSLNSRASS